MSRPIKSLSLDAVSTTGSGDVVSAKGHGNVLLFVIAYDLDPEADTLTVELEHTMNGEDWDGLAEITESDVEGRTATEYLSDMAVEELRANVTDFVDDAGGDLEVDAFISANGNPGTGYTNREA